MANLALVPQPLPGGLTGLNLTTNLVSLTSFTGVTFSNDGRMFLVMVNGATASNATVKIGTTVEGQAVASPTAYAVPVSATSVIGPFNADFAAAGFGGIVEIDFSSVVGLSVILIRDIGTR